MIKTKNMAENKKETEFNLSEKIGFVNDFEVREFITDIHPATKQEVIEVEDVKEFIKRLKEEFIKNWNPDFEDSILKQLTSHDEMCFKECDCSKIICNFIDKLAGDKLYENKNIL